MKLYIKQKLFSFGDKFTVYDQAGNDRYYVEGEVFTFGKKLHLLDLGRNELAFVHQKVWSFLPRFYVSINGVDVAQVVKEIAFLRQRYTVEGLGWEVEGDFFSHDYQITAAGMPVATVSKEWFTLGDAYEIDIFPGVDEVTALAVVLIIDACIDAANNN